MSGLFDSDPKRNPWAGANLARAPHTRARARARAHTFAHFRSFAPLLLLFSSFFRAQAYVGYCSSDAWVGDAGLESNTWRFQFRGQRILSATITALAQNFSLGASGADKVLLSGCSAGARGAMFSLDYVQALMPRGVVNVMGMLDSPLWVDELPLSGASGATMPLQNETQAVFALVNATGRLGSACAAAYPGAEGWKCLYGQARPACDALSRCAFCDALPCHGICAHAFIPLLRCSIGCRM
jgi:hypothetical protein